MKKLIALALIVCSSFMVAAQETQVKVEVQSKDVVKTRGMNSHIISKAPTTDEKPVTNPNSGEKTRGKKNCEINVVNSTGFMVEFYVDGISKGTVDSWGETTVRVPNGYKSMYAITTGQTKEWFAEGNCSGAYSFILLTGGNK